MLRLTSSDENSGNNSGPGRGGRLCQQCNTIFQEQRLLACQGTWLSSIDGRIPLQLRPFRDNVPNALKDFLNALITDSKKSSDLFRVLEVTLAASSLPRASWSMSLREHPWSDSLQ